MFFPDSSIGKSALHWAAAVNNIEAALALLKNGANKDMQDSKVRVYLGMHRVECTSAIVKGFTSYKCNYLD